MTGTLQKLGSIHEGNLILVNQRYPLYESEIQFMHLSPALNREEILLDNRAAIVLSHMMDALGARKKIVPVSGYRSEEEQIEIYDESILENGYDFTAKYVALPNHSEHQTGLAIDLAELGDNIDFICPSFPYRGICQQFRNMAPDFGFIERYQESKCHITGIGHEPWHFRYVGYPHSKIMHDFEFCLEEYMDFLKNFPYQKDHFIYTDNNQKIEIFYVSEEEEAIEIPQGQVCQISGNNMDGYIVTVWRRAHG